MNVFVWKREGFSLIESLFVLASVAIISTAAVPNIHRMQQEWLLRGGAAAVESALQWGRMHAISSNTPLLFSISDNGIRYCWIDGDSGEEYRNSARTLPDGLRIESSPGSPLRFYQHGNAVPAGTFVVAGGAGSYSVIVSPGGRIRTERN